MTKPKLFLWIAGEFIRDFWKAISVWSLLTVAIAVFHIFFVGTEIHRLSPEDMAVMYAVPWVIVLVAVFSETTNKIVLEMVKASADTYHEVLRRIDQAGKDGYSVKIYMEPGEEVTVERIREQEIEEDVP